MRNIRIESSVGVKPVRDFLGRVYLSKDGGVVIDKYPLAPVLYAASVEYYSVNRMNRRYMMCSGETVADLPLKKQQALPAMASPLVLGG